MKIIDWSGLDAAGCREALQRPTLRIADSVREGVQRTIAQVRADGDHALKALTRRFDGVELDSLRVSAQEFTVAAAQIDDVLKQALAEARERIIAWHRAGMSAEFEIDTAPGVRCGRVIRPIARVGLYVPAGSAPLPSTALMMGVPAHLAGCAGGVVCLPPAHDG